MDRINNTGNKFGNILGMNNLKFKVRFFNYSLIIKSERLDNTYNNNNNKFKSKIKLIDFNKYKPMNDLLKKMDINKSKKKGK